MASQNNLEELYANLSLEDEDEGGVLVGEDEVSPIRQTFILVGRFLADKNINFPAMQNVLAALWRPKEGVEIHDLGGQRYSFVFYHVLDMEKVVEGGPWTFEQSLLILHKLGETEDVNTVALNKIYIWVQVYDFATEYDKGEDYQIKRRLCGDCAVLYANPGKIIERAYGVWLRAPNKSNKVQNIGSKWLRNGPDGGQAWQAAITGSSNSGHDGREITSAIHGNRRSGYVYVDVQGHSGGLALLWKNEGGCRIRDVSRNFIDVEVENDQIGRWRYTGFYGCPERNRRRESWDMLKMLAGRSSLPWCVFGDFNDMLYMHEKRGGRRHPFSLLKGFSDTLQECGLTDLGFVGEQFTWKRSRGQHNWVQERLDRGVANNAWKELFPGAEVCVIEVATSDHLPIHIEGVILVEKINRCGTKLQEWGGISHRYRQQIQECRSWLRRLRSRRDAAGIQRYNKVRWEFLNLLEKQEVYWKQRAKQHWLREGDKNTRFFHRFASTRRKNNKLERIKNAEGEWQETKEGVHGVITEYFTDLFQARNVDGCLSEYEQVNILSDEENRELIADISVTEVKTVVFSMHADKASGPDGFNPAFYQAFWDIIQVDVVNFCHEFMCTGRLPEGINDAMVCLIPKIKKPQIMGDLRPISLCNVLVRILSKVLSNRLKKCLGSIISDKQSAFIEGRLLTDNALIAFEVNHFMKRKTQDKNGIAGLKIDISKAYDRLEWGFIRNMMRKFGFGQLWIDRVMYYIESVKYSFIHDGEVFGNITPGRGIRQGDPISSYIYIMCAEGLSAIIRRNEEAGMIHGCRVARGAPRISHLLFADDCYLFFKATKTEAQIMKRILNRYAEMSGQLINFNKSAITFSTNTKSEQRSEVSTQLGVQEKDEPDKYLGMPMRIGSNRSVVFGFLADRVQQKLQAWTAQNISKAGKVTLLKTSAQSIPNFWMNLLLVPREICDKIEKAMNAYWWGGGGERKGIKWMRWERLCEAKYYAHTSFLEASLGANPSYMWRSIMASQEIIKQGCKRKIGDGKSTKVWQIPWLPCKNNGYLSSEAHVELQETLVHNLMMEEDKGNFSVKSCYRQIRGESTGDEGGFWKQIWGLKLPGKVVNMVWRACKGVLPTAMKLAKKGVSLDVICAWCREQVETPIHTVFTCPFAREVWAQVGMQEIIPLDEGVTVLQVLKEAFSRYSRDRRVMIGVYCWGLWWRRNSWVWDRKSISTFGVKSMVMSLVQEWQRSQETGQGARGRKCSVNKRWCRPQEGWVKINIDAACHDQVGYIGAGCIVRDDRGRFIRARSIKIRGGWQPREAEALSLKEALSWVREWRSSRCVFELDAKIVVEAVYTNGGNSNFHTIIEDCRDILKHFQEVLVVFDHQSANTVAHLLAQAACSMTDQMEWLDTAPDFILCNLFSDEI
ncbi:uncharacterized protein LOC141714399 [Apium graveolens]|uniref:uncharacterized protein LOC141714399 n=1 Tax=Apium graveolens TaxID=4045 RepID=UPI003D7A51C7